METMEKSAYGRMVEEILKERQKPLNRLLAGKGLNVEIRKVYKPGMGEKYGYEVHRTDGSTMIAPIVYQRPEWVLMDDRELAGIILEAAKKSEEFLNSGIPEFTKSEILKNVLPRVLNEDNTYDLLREGIPFQRIGNLDLLTMYYVPYGDNGMVSINSRILDGAGIHQAELHEAAVRNIRNQTVFRTLESAICSLTGEEEEPAESAMGLWVATTRNGRYGAGVFAAGMDLFREFGKKLRAQKLIILPSSVHEVLVMEDIGMDVRDMGRMVREINISVVQEGDVLSDSVYTVDLEQGTIVCHK